jgi:hypothetical protein
MKFAATLRSVAIASLLLACSSAVFAQKEKGAAAGDLPDFSATEIRGSIHWKIHRSGSKLRVDPSSAGATIWLPEEDKVYNLLILPEKTTCVVMKAAQAKMMRSSVQLVYGPNTTRTPTAAKEVVDGHTCTVLEGYTTTPDGNKFNSKIWAADDLKGVPLRIDIYSDPGIVTSTYHDVVLGTPDPALFKLPSKCIPPEKTYQVAPKNRQLPVPVKPATDEKTPGDKPQ